MTLLDTFDEDIDVAYTDWGESVSYTPEGGEASTITAIITRDSENLEDYVRGEDTAHITVRVKAADVSDPGQGDTLVYDSATWELDPRQGVIAIYDDEFEIVFRRVDG